MVHGGLRYIAQLDIKLTKHSVLERERLLKEAPGLSIVWLSFTLRKGAFPGKLIFNGLLAVCDCWQVSKTHDYFENAALQKRVPGINTDDLKGASYYTDAVTDDAPSGDAGTACAVADGAQIIIIAAPKRWSAKVTGHGYSACWCQAKAKDLKHALSSMPPVPGLTICVHRWAMRNRYAPRGSHLVIPRALAPVSDSLTLFHPKDKRPVFLFPLGRRHHYRHY